MHLPTDARFLLQIEPKKDATEPLVDDYTRAGAFLLNGAKDGAGWRGWHTCVCGACSGSTDLILSDKSTTNSLAVHYLARHRAEVPKGHLERVLALRRAGRADAEAARRPDLRVA